MRRPIGVTAVAVYLCFDCAVTLGYAVIDLRSFGVHVWAFWAGLVLAGAFGLVAWGLLRLKEWARFLAMLAIAIWAGERLPLYLLRPRRFDGSYFLIVAEELIDLFAVWYLFRLSTAKHFGKPAKTTSSNFPRTQSSYSISAKYYDGAYAAKADLLDLPFYVDLAKRIGGPVLEMGCGTGRVLLPVARSGIQIHGLDNSTAMLKVLRDQIGKEPAEVRKRIVLHEGDVRGFRGSLKYPLVTIPFRPMQHMYTVEDQVKALETAKLHLQDKGTLAFDVFFPKLELITANLGVEMPEMEWPDPSHPGRIVRRYFKKDAVDKVNQIFSFTFIYRTYEGDTLVLDETEAFQLGYYTYPHLKSLFRIVGLRVAEEYGSFAKAPLDNNATDMIFLLKKSD